MSTHSDHLPLLRRSAPLPGESLPSLLVRLARLNYYDSPMAVVRLCEERLVQPDHVTYPSKADTYRVLADLVRVEVNDLHAISVHCFAAIVTPPDRELRRITLPSGKKAPVLTKSSLSYFWFDYDTRFCPHCLAKAPYHRLEWTPVLMSACLTHKCLLVRECPRCHGRIRIPDTLEATCSSCSFDLANTPTFSIAGDELGLLSQMAIHAWLGMSSPVDPNLRRLSLPIQPPRVIFRLLDGLRRVIGRSQLTWDYFHQVPGVVLSQVPTRGGKKGVAPLYSYILCATAFKALVNWPDGFHGFLLACNLLKNPEGIPRSLGRDFEFILYYLNAYWKDAAFQFVQEAFDQHVTERYVLSRSVLRSSRYRDNTALQESFTYISSALAARLLHTSPRVIKRLVSAGQLSNYASVGDGRSSPIVRRDEVLKLEQLWSQAVSLQEAANRLGLSKGIVVDLVRTGLLTAERGPDVEGSGHWAFSKQALCDCSDKVITRTRRCHSILTEAVDLTTATKSLAVVGLNAAGAIKLVADGRLRAFDPFCKLGDLYFRKVDIEACAETIRKENGGDQHEEVARQSEVKPATASRWEWTGLLAPVLTVAHAQYYDNECLGHLKYNQTAESLGYISIADAGRLLHTSSSVVKRLIVTGQLTGYTTAPAREQQPPEFVKRDDVLEFQHLWSEKLSLQETARQMGLAEAVVVDLVKANHLVAERCQDVEGNDHWVFTRQALYKYSDKVLKHTRRGTSALAEVVDLAAATEILAAVGLNTAGTLKLVGDGKLRVFDPLCGLGRLIFRKTDVQACVEEIKRGNRWIQQKELAREMAVKPATVSRWVRAGLLSPVARHASAQYFDRGEVEAFRTGHCFSKEAAAKLGVGADVIQKWARRGRLKPVSGPGVDDCHRYLFRIADIDRLRPRRYLTATQLAEHFGISRSQLWVWIKQGKVTPISGPGVDKCRHYLFAAPEAEDD